MTEIMIFQEKYSNRYFVVETKEDQARVALKILRERYEMGHWYPNAPLLKSNREYEIAQLQKNTDQVLLEMTDEQIESLPKSLQEKVDVEKARYQRSLRAIERTFNEDSIWVEQLEQLLSADPDDAVKMTMTTSRGREFNLATYLLDSRKGYQYEDFYMENPESY